MPWWLYYSQDHHDTWHYCIKACMEDNIIHACQHLLSPNPISCSTLTCTATQWRWNTSLTSHIPPSLTRCSKLHRCLSFIPSSRPINTDTISFFLLWPHELPKVCTRPNFANISRLLDLVGQSSTQPQSNYSFCDRVSKQTFGTRAKVCTLMHMSLCIWTRVTHA